jgi:hypothetical protein
MCWLELGLVFASPLSESPLLELELLLLEAPLELLLELPLDPHAATTTADAIAATAVSVSRYGRI